MPKGAPGIARVPTLYTLAHGIEVIGERRMGRYIMCRIRPHRFFPNSRVFGAHQEVQRSRVVMSAHLGRALERNEHVHHGRLGRLNDDLSNLELLTAAAHNKHHKSGTRHRPEIKAQISEGVRRAYLEGRRTPADPDVARRNISRANEAIRSGRIPHPTAKPDRNKGMIEFYRRGNSVKKTAAAFSITLSSAREILLKHAPQHYRHRPRRAS